MGFWVLVMMGQALLMSPKGRNTFRDGLVKLWEGGFCYLQYYYFVKQPRHLCKHAYKARRMRLFEEHQKIRGIFQFFIDFYLQ